MSEIQKKLNAAVKFLRGWCNEYEWSSRFLPGMEPDLTPQLCFSGGKDSVLTKFVCDLAGIRYRMVYSVTTIDPPPLIYFIEKKFPEVHFRPAGKNFFKEMEYYGFPIRQNRWCCKVFKENTGDAMLKIIGVRAAESERRAKQWKPLTAHRDSGIEEFYLCPVLAFTDHEVWEITRAEGLPYCELYDCGWKRIGCIGCPMATVKERRMQLKTFPRFEMKYRKAFSRLWENRANTISPKTGLEWFGSRKFICSDDLFEWWISGISSPEDLIKSGFTVDDLELPNGQTLFDFSESCDMGLNL